MLGGIAGLVGTSILGPRQSIFDKATVDKLVKAENLKKRKINERREKMADEYNHNKSHSKSRSSSESINTFQQS